MGLCFYFSGIIDIIIFDYISQIKSIQDNIFSLVYISLSLLTGGMGFVFFFGAFLEYFRFHKWANELFGLLLLGGGGFISFGGFLYDLFFWKIASKACRIAFLICYFFCFSCFQVIKPCK